MMLGTTNIKCHSVVLENPAFIHLVNSPLCKKPKGSLQCSEGPLICTYSGPDELYLLFFFSIFCEVLYDTVNFSG